jgi:cyclophilin family peptidyl-prolyl cis-trans isomerase
MNAASQKNATIMIRRWLVPATTGTTTTAARQFGTRGARGHGWFVQYRSGRGGRHLQGEYYDRETAEQCAAWNDAILQLGNTRVYMDICLEPRRSTVSLTSKMHPVPPLDQLTGEKHRLVLDLATTVMPATTQNFIHLLCKSAGTTHGYVGSRFFRVEKKVGLKGGDVLTNTGKTGQAGSYSGRPLQMPVPSNEPLCLWHIPGTVSMLVPTVDEIDSRFILVSEPAPHLDGVCRALGRLTPDSLALVDRWQSTLITTKGIPTAYDLIICAGGVVLDHDNDSGRQVDHDHAAAVAA